MFVNPGGPGSSGVDFVEALADDLDEWGAGRFDVVSWDPRGTNGSTPVICFTSDAARDQFWAGRAIPFTRTRRRPTSARPSNWRDGAARSAAISWLTSRLPTPPAIWTPCAGMVGDDLLDLRGPVLRDVIGQTYINLFPKRIRAMVLDGIVDPVDVHEERRDADASKGAAFDAVFSTFLALCESAGPVLCPGRARRDRRAAGGASVRHGPPVVDPGAALRPPGALDYADCSSRRFNPLRARASGPRFAADLNAAADGDASNLEDAGPPFGPRLVSRARPPRLRSRASTVPPASPRSAWPEVIPKFTESSTFYGPLLGWWLWAPCASNWPGQSTDRYAGPWGAKTTTPILLMNNRHDPATGYHNAGRRTTAGQRRAADLRRLRPPDDERPQPVRRPGEDPLPRDPRPPGPRHRLQGRRAPVLPAVGTRSTRGACRLQAFTRHRPQPSESNAVAHRPCRRGRHGAIGHGTTKSRDEHGPTPASYPAHRRNSDEQSAREIERAHGRVPALMPAPRSF